MIYKTAELEGALLNAAVEKSEGRMPAHGWNAPGQSPTPAPMPGQFPEYSSDWKDGGPIIERERIVVVPTTGIGETMFWTATHCGPEGTFSHYIDETLPFRRYSGDQPAGDGATPLIAAMRAYVASKFGDEVELP